MQVVRSSANKCASCQNTNSSCHLISGLFTKRNLPPGYNLITRIPKGSCSINISFLSPSNNHFGNTFRFLSSWSTSWHYSAIKFSKDDYLIDSLSLSGSYLGAGTEFLYTRGDAVIMEKATAVGPLEETIKLEVKRHLYCYLLIYILVICIWYQPWSQLQVFEVTN